MGLIQEKLFNLLNDLYGIYRGMGDEIQASKTSDEMEMIEEAFSKINERAQDYLNTHSDIMWGTGSVTSDWDTLSASKELTEEEF